MINSAVFLFISFLLELLLFECWLPYCFPLPHYFVYHLHFLILLISFISAIKFFISKTSLFYSLNVPFIPPCSFFMDAVSVLFSDCCNNYVFVSFLSLCSLCTIPLADFFVLVSLFHFRAISQMSGKPCLSAHVWK